MSKGRGCRAWRLDSTKKASFPLASIQKVVEHYLNFTGAGCFSTSSSISKDDG